MRAAKRAGNRLAATLLQGLHGGFDVSFGAGLIREFAGATRITFSSNNTQLVTAAHLRLCLNTVNIRATVEHPVTFLSSIVCTTFSEQGRPRWDRGATVLHAASRWRSMKRPSRDYCPGAGTAESSKRVSTAFAALEPPSSATISAISASRSRVNVARERHRGILKEGFHSICHAGTRLAAPRCPRSTPRGPAYAHGDACMTP